GDSRPRGRPRGPRGNAYARTREGERESARTAMGESEPPMATHDGLRNRMTVASLEVVPRRTSPAPVRRSSHSFDLSDTATRSVGLFAPGPQPAGSSPASPPQQDVSR